MESKTQFHLIDRKTKEVRATVEIVELDDGDVGLCGEDGRVLFSWPKPGYVRQVQAYVKEMAAREGYWLKIADDIDIAVDDIWGGKLKPKKCQTVDELAEGTTVVLPIGQNPAGEYEPEDLYPDEIW